MDNQDTLFRLMIEHLEEVIFALDLDLRCSRNPKGPKSYIVRS